MAPASSARQLRQQLAPARILVHLGPVGLEDQASSLPAVADSDAAWAWGLKVLVWVREVLALVDQDRAVRKVPAVVCAAVVEAVRPLGNTLP